ncbi:TadE/TadG family type IV pilus assembly protein [Tropicimonas sp. IMCC6043]|uniref:TadE/TadG family type IV pilus assembly protein n=1 Tax=Tropicimonas sp. IMCC6043 TaxID=2510645 RepID=UPI00101D1348|nr:TadE/TadG family type IV pilus assembly protein [Tropicimonas sp. IMCC6043]RYH11292.1 pilus assembly protein [Tropicimonas sp. IMCC6043]
MTYRISSPRALLARFGRHEDGATIVELAIVLPIFLLIFLGLIDFGRLAFHFSATEKAVQLAARIAAVRPPACDALVAFLDDHSDTNPRGSYTDVSGPRFGTNCAYASGVCLDPKIPPCAGNAAADADARATVDEIWTMLQFAVPNDPTADFDKSNLTFSYEFDPDMNFLGGPFVPMVTVTIEELPFRFVSPLGALAALAANGATAESDALTTVTTNFKIFSDFSATLPGEDLASGSSG